MHSEAKLPIADASVFMFENTQIPECIIVLQREGGILIGCDAIQNWIETDCYFSEQSSVMMTDMGFFTPANIGPVWMQFAQPEASDFERLQKISYSHALCGHGKPLLHSAKTAYQDTFSKIFHANSEAR